MTGRAIVGIYAEVAVAYAREAREIVAYVTGRAIQGCRNMAGRLSNTDLTVMALRAIVNVDSDVIEYRARKIHGVMARRTVFGCRYVVDELAYTDHIIVA